MKYARIENEVVVEIIESDNIDDCYHPTFVATLTKVDAEVEVGMVKVGDNFELLPSAPSIDEQRANMNLSAVQVRLNLAKAGLLLGIIERINNMPDDTELKIMWEYATVFKRLDPTLVEFCKQSMGMSDETIDNLFMP